MAEHEKSSPNGETQKTSNLDLAGKSEKGSNGRSEAGLSLATPKEPKGEIEVSSFSVAGLRPIAPSNLEIAATILHDRPIMVSHLRVVNHVGSRPIFASDIVVREDLNLAGGRPIVASDPKLLQASLLPGGRPIASNEIDDSSTLMGFID